MNFKEWAENNADFDQWIVEFKDIASSGTGDIQLTTQYHQNIKVYEFSIDGDDFEVLFKKETEAITGFDIDVWYVSFEGPNGTNTTHKNKNATAIYRNVLLSIKKLMESEDVKGLYFFSAEPAMALVYDRFYKQFLSNDFVRIRDIFIRKDIVRNILNDKSKPEWQRDRLKELILSASRYKREYLKRVRQEKMNLRNLRTSL